MPPDFPSEKIVNFITKAAFSNLLKFQNIFDVRTYKTHTHPFIMASRRIQAKNAQTKKNVAGINF